MPPVSLFREILLRSFIYTNTLVTCLTTPSTLPYRQSCEENQTQSVFCLNKLWWVFVQWLGGKTTSHCSIFIFGDLLYMNTSTQCLHKFDMVYHASLRFITNCRRLTHHYELYSRISSRMAFFVNKEVGTLIHFHLRANDQCYFVLHLPPQNWERRLLFSLLHLQEHVTKIMEINLHIFLITFKSRMRALSMTASLYFNCFSRLCM